MVQAGSHTDQPTQRVVFAPERVVLLHEQRERVPAPAYLLHVEPQRAILRGPGSQGDDGADRGLADGGSEGQRPAAREGKCEECEREASCEKKDVTASRLVSRRPAHRQLVSTLRYF